MTQVEYQWQTKDFTELKTNISGQKFRDLEVAANEVEYLFDVNIDEYKIPLLKIIVGAMFGGVTQGGESGQSESDSQMTAVVEGLLKQYIDGPLLLLANAKVYWQEGAKTVSIDAQMVLTNQKKINEVIQTLGAISGAAGANP